MNIEVYKGKNVATKTMQKKRLNNYSEHGIEKQKKKQVFIYVSSCNAEMQVKHLV